MLSTQNDEFETVQHQVTNESPQNSNSSSSGWRGQGPIPVKVGHDSAGDNTTGLPTNQGGRHRGEEPRRVDNMSRRVQAARATASETEDATGRPDRGKRRQNEGLDPRPFRGFDV